MFKGASMRNYDCQDSHNEGQFPGFPEKLQYQSWQFPSIINGFVHSLTGAEFKVLWYILRHTFGWQKNTDRLSISQIQKGITKKNGEILDSGTGLSRPSVIKSASNLETMGFIETKKAPGKVTVYTVRLVKNFNQTSKKSLPVASKEILPTINNNTKNNNTNIHEQKIRVYKRFPKEKQQCVHRLCYHLEDLTGTRIVNWGKQGKAMSAMLRAGFTEEEIKRTITYMAKGDEFFSDKGFDLVTVSNSIGRYKSMSERKL